MKYEEKEQRILAALADGPLSSRALGDFAELNSYQLYSALPIMEAKRLIVSEFEDGPSPRRRTYSLPKD